MESALNNIIEKISSYEIFNNIIPGVIYFIFTEKLTSFSVKTGNAFMSAILLYFIGLVIGRIGSIFSSIIGSIFSKLGWKHFLNFAPYHDYIQIESKDKKERIHNLVSISNMYRTFASLFVCLIITVIFDRIWPDISSNDCYKTLTFIMCFALLAILFIFSYRKQTEYITQRIDAMITNISDEENLEEKRINLKQNKTNKHHDY